MPRRSAALDRAAAAGTRGGGRSAGWASGTSGPLLGGDARGASAVDAARPRRACCSAIGVQWFRKGGGMPRVSLAPVSGRSVSSRSERRSLSCSLVVVECGRSPVSWVVRRRRSPESYNGTLRSAPAAPVSGPRPRRRMPTVAPGRSREAAGRGQIPSSAISGAAAVQRPDGSLLVRRSAGAGRRPEPRKDRRWGHVRPEQIASRLRVDFPDDESMRISHEAIYQSLYVQGRGALRRELTACLRTGRALRVPRARTSRGNRSS